MSRRPSVLRRLFYEARTEARSCFLRGDYIGAIEACDKFLALAVSEDTELSLPILNDKSRALRNLGRIQEALDCHVAALRAAHSTLDPHAEAWQLVQFGKIFGKYLERQTLFSACLREAAHRYESLIGRTATPKLTVQFAIVQDLLGSYYRRLAERTDRNPSAQHQSEEAYRLSIELHKSVGNWEGVSRAQCHLAYARAMFVFANERRASSERTALLREALISFEQGIRLVLLLPDAMRGRGTRRAQEAHIYLMLGNVEQAGILLSEALEWAEESNDPRAKVIAKTLIGELHLKMGRAADAGADFSEALAIAKGMHLGGFQRKISASLAKLWMKTGNVQRAIQAYQEIEELIKRELLEFSSGFRGAIDVLREVAPERADFYLIEGQQHDYEAFIYELVSNGQFLRSVIRRYEQSKSDEYQFAIYRFVKTSLQHSVKNHMQRLALLLMSLRETLDGMDARTMRKSKTSRFLDVCEASIEQIGEILNANAPEEKLEPTSLRMELETSLEAHFGNLDLILFELDEDIIFPHLMPGLLKGALEHLIENAHTAVRFAPPPGGVPVFVLRQEESPVGGQRILLMNPGTNPQELSTFSSGTPTVHGFQTAQRFFKEILNFGCRFELREHGPRTPPFMCNCVVLDIPPPGEAVTVYQRIEVGREA